MRLPSALPALVLAAAGVLTGCSSAEVRLVNNAAVASRTGVMDDASRLLAQDTLRLLAGRDEDYCVGPGDVLDITVFEWEVRGQAKSGAFRVSANGAVSLPVTGDLEVAGRSTTEIRQAVEQALCDGGIILQPQVSVEVREFNSKRIAVLGAVRQPGAHVLQKNNTTLLEAIGAASGLDERAGYVAYVLRPLEKPPEAAVLDTDAAEPRIITIDLSELMEKGDLTLNVVLEPGSVVNIPQAGLVSVIGYVNKPGSFPLLRPTTVLEAIAQAGGLKEREASPSHSFIKRRAPAGGEQIYELDVVAISRGESPNFVLAPGDVIDVRQRLSRRFLLGFWDAFKNMFNVGYTLN